MDLSYQIPFKPYLYKVEQGRQMRKQKKKADVRNSESVLRPLVKGVVTPRKCEHCGHHEMGIITEDGEYRGLKKGMKIILMGE